jgi:peroxiredoxin
VPKLKEIYTALKEKGFVIVGVHTTEDSEKMAAFVKKQKIDWPVVIDAEGNKTSKTYNVEGYPTTVLIDKNGKIVETYLGDHPDQETIEKLLKQEVKDEKKADPKKADEKKADEKKAD